MSTNIKHKHFVTFVIPGTFFHEESNRPVEAWDTVKAVELSREVVERHGAKPFGFYFHTALVADPIDDGRGDKLAVEPKQIAKSGMYFIGGALRTVDDIVRDAKPDEQVLLSNMQCNDFPIVCVNTNSYRSTNPFNEQDCIVNPDTGEIIERGDTAERKKYRKEKAEQHRREIEAMLAKK